MPIYQMLRADNSGVISCIWPNSDLIKAFTYVLVEYEDDSNKNEGARFVSTFFPLEVYGDFSRCSRAANSAVLRSIWSNFEPVLDVIDVRVTCKNKEDPIKNKSARGVTRFSPL